MSPEISLHPLARADGSTVFSDGLFTIIAGANGPVEVQRRDEIPDEAAIEVNVRPSAGVGGLRERWLEGVVHAVLKSIVLVHMHPRTLIQVTLQIAQEPQVALAHGIADIAIIPSLINSAFMAVIDSGLPLSTIATAVLVTATPGGDIIVMPEERQLKVCHSVHALAFTREGQQVLNQSLGEFDLALWEGVADRAQATCEAAVGLVTGSGDDSEMSGASDTKPAAWLRNTLEERARKVNTWRESN